MALCWTACEMIILAMMILMAVHSVDSSITSSGSTHSSNKNVLTTNMLLADDRKETSYHTRRRTLKGGKKGKSSSSSSSNIKEDKKKKKKKKRTSQASGDTNEEVVTPEVTKAQQNVDSTTTNSPSTSPSANVKPTEEEVQQDVDSTTTTASPSTSPPEVEGRISPETPVQANVNQSDILKFKREHYLKEDRPLQFVHLSHQLLKAASAFLFGNVQLATENNRVFEEMKSLEMEMTMVMNMIQAEHENERLSAAAAYYDGDYYYDTTSASNNAVRSFQLAPSSLNSQSSNPALTGAMYQNLLHNPKKNHFQQANIISPETPVMQDGTMYQEGDYYAAPAVFSLGDDGTSPQLPMGVFIGEMMGCQIFVETSKITGGLDYLSIQCGGGEHHNDSDTTGRNGAAVQKTTTHLIPYEERSTGSVFAIVTDQHYDIPLIRSLFKWDEDAGPAPQEEDDLNVNDDNVSNGDDDDDTYSDDDAVDNDDDDNDNGDDDVVPAPAGDDDTTPVAFDFGDDDDNDYNDDDNNDITRMTPSGNNNNEETPTKKKKDEKKNKDKDKKKKKKKKKKKDKKKKKRRLTTAQAVVEGQRQQRLRGRRAIFADRTTSNHNGEHDGERLWPRMLQDDDDDDGGRCEEYFIIELAAVFESSFCQSFEGATDDIKFQNAKAKVEATVAAASILYEQYPLCSRIKIVYMEGHCNMNTDPYRPSVLLNKSGCGRSGSGVLQGVQQYWRTSRTNVKRDIVHLFSGTGLECLNGGTAQCVVGCAYIGSLCSNVGGYGVSYTMFSKDTNLQSVLFAHELGHSSGAQHYQQTSLGYIMNARVNQAAFGFAPESIRSILSQLNNKRRSCISTELNPIITFAPTSSPTPAPIDPFAPPTTTVPRGGGDTLDEEANCMAGNTGVIQIVKKDDDDSNYNSSNQQTEVVSLVKHLKVGDVIKGYDKNMNPSSECVVEAVGYFGYGPMIGNYTKDHFVLLNEPTATSSFIGPNDKNTSVLVVGSRSTTMTHANDNNSNNKLIHTTSITSSSNTMDDRYDVLTSCPLGVDESGIAFTSIDRHFCDLKQMSWSDYVLVHSAMLRLIRNSGTYWFSSMAYKDTSMKHVKQYLPKLCDTILSCSKNHQTCHELEDYSHTFVHNVLSDTALQQTLEKLPNLGNHQLIGSVSDVVSQGKTVR